MRTTPLLLLLSTVAVGGCELDEMTLLVDHFQVPCKDEGLRLCPMIRTENEPTPSPFYEDIGGWEPTWGQTETLRVLRAEATRTQGGANVSYTLLEVVETDDIPVGTSFTYAWKTNDETDTVKGVTLNETGGTLLDGKPFTCKTPTVCADLQDALGSNHTINLQLRYADPLNAPFEAWNASIGAATFQPEP